MNRTAAIAGGFLALYLYNRWQKNKQEENENDKKE